MSPLVNLNLHYHVSKLLGRICSSDPPCCPYISRCSPYWWREFSSSRCELLGSTHLSGLAACGIRTYSNASVQGKSKRPCSGLLKIMAKQRQIRSRFHRSRPPESRWSTPNVLSSMYSNCLKSCKPWPPHWVQLSVSDEPSPHLHSHHIRGSPTLVSQPLLVAAHDDNASWCRCQHVLHQFLLHQGCSEISDSTGGKDKNANDATGNVCWRFDQPSFWEVQSRFEGKCRMEGFDVSLTTFTSHWISTDVWKGKRDVKWRLPPKSLCRVLRGWSPFVFTGFFSPGHQSRWSSDFYIHFFLCFLSKKRSVDMAFIQNFMV